MPSETQTTLSGASPSGTATQLGPQSTLLSVLPITESVVANAGIDPTDTPTRGELRVQSDATGLIGLYYYSLSLATWKAVSLA